MDSTFGERLKMAMAFRGMSRKAVDAIAGFADGFTGRVISGKRGKRPGPDTVRRFAEAVNVSFMWLADGRGGMLDGVQDVAADPHPNRTVVTASKAFADAPPEVQTWFARLRRPSDLTPAEWAKVLESGAFLNGLGFLPLRAVKKLE